MTTYIFDEVANIVARWFSPLSANDYFQCQTPLQNAKFDLFGSEKSQLANLVVNRDWLIVTVLQAMHFPAILSNCMRVYICRRFLTTTAFLVPLVDKRVGGR